MSTTRAIDNRSEDAMNRRQEGRASRRSVLTTAVDLGNDSSAHVLTRASPRALQSAGSRDHLIAVVLMLSLSRAACSRLPSRAAAAALAASRTGHGLRCFAAAGKAGKFGRGDDEFDPDYESEDRKRLFEPDDFDALQYDKDTTVKAATPPSIQWIRDTDDAIDKELALRQQEKEKALRGEKPEGEKPPEAPEVNQTAPSDPDLFSIFKMFIFFNLDRRCQILLSKDFDLCPSQNILCAHRAAFSLSNYSAYESILYYFDGHGVLSYIILKLCGSIVTILFHQAMAIFWKVSFSRLTKESSNFIIDVV